MRIIDLLNKIANGEEVPKKFIWDDKEYYLQSNKCYKCDETSHIFEEDFILENLDDEVEILEEENKIPEKLKILNANEHTKAVYYENYLREEIALDIETLQNWVNKIIDYLKSKGE